MHPNEALIRRFYTAFGQLDYRTMQDCYRGDAIFNDPVFGLLQGDAIRAMWEMLCKNAKDFSLEFSNICLLDEEYATCDWTAAYTFSKTGRHVVNAVKAHLQVVEGKIAGHTDQFDLWKWCRQALGLPGLLFGWNGFAQERIRARAKKQLEAYMRGQ